MFDILQTIITFLITISLLVVVHEWGHFIAARVFGVRVDDFSIGFGRRLVRLGRRGDTEYNLRILPLGGFVKIAGMAADEEPIVKARDAIQDRGTAESIPEPAPSTPTEPGPDEFGSKPIWQRILIIFAGPFMSFVLAYVVFCLIGLTTGWPNGRLLTRIAEVEAGGEGQRVGLYTGDEVVAINGKPLTDGLQMVSLIRHNAGHPITLTIRHNGRVRTAIATPQPHLLSAGKPEWTVDVVSPGSLASFGLLAGDEIETVDGKPLEKNQQLATVLANDTGKRVTLDVARGLDEEAVDALIPANYAAHPALLSAPHEVGLLQILPDSQLSRSGLLQSVREANAVLVNIFQMLADRIHQHDLQKTAGGSIMMYQATASAVKDRVETGFRRLSLIAELSLSLAIFNLLPIPILDGGHILALFIEWVRRGKKMTEQQQQAFLMTGLAIIALLVVCVFANDILRTVRHQVPQ